MTLFRRLISSLLLASLAASFPAAAVSAQTAAVGEADEQVENWFTVLDESLKTVWETGLVVSVGDSFITEDNKQYTVTHVEGYRATARFDGDVDLEQDTALTDIYGPGEELEPVRTPLARLADAIQAITLRNRPLPVSPVRRQVAVYHSHSDESYVPTDGTHSKRAAGGILRVGRALSSALRRQNLRAVHSTASHDPHDSKAYIRSRRTARELISRRPMAVFDVHRDTAPAKAYRTTIDGQPASKVMIVIGRQNPNMKANLQFAKRLKRVVDARHPGLIKGILFAKGHYNQDLYQRSLLLEVGSHRTPRSHAERSVAALASAVPEVLGAGRGQGPFARPEADGAQARGSWAALWWVLGLFLVGGTIYLLVSSGNWRLATRRLLGGERGGDDKT